MDKEKALKGLAKCAEEKQNSCDECPYSNVDEVCTTMLCRDVLAVINGGNVDHPDYYVGKIEVIDFIEAHELGFHLGNVVKYVSRAGKKNPETELEDLEKARWYLDRYIEMKTQEGMK